VCANNVNDVVGIVVVYYLVNLIEPVQLISEVIIKVYIPVLQTKNSNIDLQIEKQ